AGLAMRHASRPASVALASIVDRVIDTLALILITFAGIVWVSTSSPALAVVVKATAFLVPLGLVGCAALWWALKRYKSGRYFKQLAESLEALLCHPGRLIGALLMSMLIQSVLVMVNAYLGLAVGVDCGLGAWF